MADVEEGPWGKVAGLAAAALTVALILRGIRGLVRIAFGEARYRANDPDTWLKWVAR